MHCNCTSVSCFLFVQPQLPVCILLICSLDVCVSIVLQYIDTTSNASTVTVSLHGLVVRALTQNVRGVRFDPHWGLYTFQTYFLEMFKRVKQFVFNASVSGMPSNARPYPGTTNNLYNLFLFHY